MIEHKIKTMERKQLERQKKVYDGIGGFFMILTLLSLLFSIKVAIVSVLFTVLALSSSSATGMRLQLLDAELVEETVDKYLKDE